MTDADLGPDAIEWLGTRYRTVMAPADSGGAMSIVDSVSPPNSGPPRHVHDAEDEAFVILSGECEFWVAGDRFVKGPGETAFIPRGTEHTFRVIGTVPCRHMIILTPGGFEAFFGDMAAAQFRIPDDMGPITESAGRHNLRFTGPPLGAEEEGAE